MRAQSAGKNPTNDAIEFTVVSEGKRYRYGMPMTDRPVPSLGGLPADMLQGATLIVDEERMIDEAQCFEAGEPWSV